MLITMFCKRIYNKISLTSSSIHDMSWYIYYISSRLIITCNATCMYNTYVYTYSTMHAVYKAHVMHSYLNTFKIVVVRLSVTDVDVAITNLRVVCKIITCVSACTEIAKAAARRNTLRCRLRKGCHCRCVPSH